MAAGSCVALRGAWACLLLGLPDTYGGAIVTSYPSDYISQALEREPAEAVAKGSIYARTLQAAAAIVGGERALARFLKVPMPDLFVWMQPGAERPPVSVFLRAVDIVLHDLELPEQERAQTLRVTAAHHEWSKLGPAK
jgi:hypothetical protein